MAIGQKSKLGAIKVLIGSIMALLMRIFQVMSKDLNENRMINDHSLPFMCILMFTTIKIMLSICYLTINLPCFSYCWTNDSGVGDDYMQSHYTHCHSNLCANLNVNATNIITNSQGTLTEYCTVDCCYWKT